MPRCKPHHHPCQRCGHKTQCGGTWEENYDGFPEVICREFHEPLGTINADFICEGCEWAEEDARNQARMAEADAEARERYEAEDRDGR